MKKILEINNLTKKYKENIVLKSINLEINKWDFFALLWKNWAWKTTAIWIITNLVSKNSWEIKIWWIDIDKNFWEARKIIWVVPQEFNFDIFDSVENIIITQAWFYWMKKNDAKKRTEFLLKKLELWDKKNKSARSLSGWMKRRLMIARALVHSPKFLILDEPTAWVDVELRKSMWDFIKELNENWTTILLTTHYLEEVEALCNKVAIIDKWEVVENSSLKNLLKKLDEEIFIFETEKEINIDFCKKLEKYKAQIINKNSFEISVSKKDFINDIFKILEKEKIQIKSFKNKSSRLEQLFINLIKK